MVPDPAEDSASEAAQVLDYPVGEQSLVTFDGEQENLGCQTLSLEHCQTDWHQIPADYQTPAGLENRFRNRQIAAHQNPASHQTLADRQMPAGLQNLVGCQTPAGPRNPASHQTLAGLPLPVDRQVPAGPQI